MKAAKYRKPPSGLGRPWAVAFAFAALIGCGAGDGGSTDIESGDMRLTVQLASVVVGQNRMMIEVADLAGAMIEGVGLAVDPQMATHGHGSTEVPLVSERGGGHYEAFPVTFQMPGAWEITVSATAGALSAKKTIHVTVR
ncbi:MAG: FixH family protein [Myxococcales bacterium]|nr:FixH family protein [Myxococcales bacterium]